MPDANYYRMLIKCDWPEPDEDGEPLSFIARYEVVAPSRNHAMEIVERFEPEESRSTLELDECIVVAECPDQPTGVYFASERMFFPTDSKE